MPSHQYVIVSCGDSGASRPGSDNGMAPLGPRRELIERLAAFNTAPESTDEADVLYGPGIRLELPPEQDPVPQMLMTLTEEEIAWPVISRIGKALSWKIMDLDTGRELTF